MSAGSTTRDDLHRLIDQLSDDKVDMALRFLKSLWQAGTEDNAIKQFLETMSSEEAALLDAMAAFDDRLGPPPFVEADSDPSS